jgi:feruloyl esterase
MRNYLAPTLAMIAPLASCASDVPPSTAMQPGGMTCEALAGSIISGGRIVSATTVTDPAVPASSSGASSCRVKAVLTPSPQSAIAVELWLPDRAHWNGKFLGTGNGGAAGSIRTAALADGLARGYAVANTDMGTGSSGLDFSFAIGKPELMKDFGYRSTEGMTTVGKALTASYYGRAPEHAYFAGCSTGGHQAWQAAQTLYRDYDGIIAAAPANRRTHTHISVMNGFALTSRNLQSRLTSSNLAMIQRASVAACDLDDGVKDGVIGDPASCRFDPGVLQCKAAGGADCLTGGQVDTMRRLYDGTRNPRTGAEIFPGVAPGGEGGLILELPPGMSIGGVGEYSRAPDGRLIVRKGLINWSTAFQKAHPDGLGFDFDKDVALVDNDIGRYLNFENADLAAFRRRGGKALLWHGWADSGISPKDSIRFYGRIREANGGAASTSSFARLFMAPGVAHCGGGYGAGTFDMIAALEAWVERGHAPSSILATRAAKPGQPAISRPLCPFPQVARWTGRGSSDDAANFTCAAPAPARRG